MKIAFDARPIILASALLTVACDRSENVPSEGAAREAQVDEDPITSDPIGFLEKANEFWMTPHIHLSDVRYHHGENLRLAMLASLQGDTAVADFQRMLGSDDEVSVLYGLVGLYFCDSLKYRDYVKQVQDRIEEKAIGNRVDSVPFAADLPVQAIVSELLHKHQAARIEYGQTLTEHCRRTKQAIDQLELDFFGGGIPLHFLDPGVVEAYNEQLEEKSSSDPDGEMRIYVMTGSQLSDRADFLRIWADSFVAMMTKAEQEYANRSSADVQSKAEGDENPEPNSETSAE